MQSHGKGIHFEKKKVIANIIKWSLVLGLLLFACIKYKRIMLDSLYEVAHTPVWKLIICFALANLFFMAEGLIISRMTATSNKMLSIGQGISCTYMCAFYRLATLGNGNGIAQLYYYNVKGIPVAEGLGMAISQYTFQKITIGILGVISFIAVTAFGTHSLLKYTWFMLAGVIVISLICIFLLLITISQKISDFVMMLARKIVNPHWKLYAKLDQAQNAIDSLQRQSRLIWKDKKLFIEVILLNIFKLSCWYFIPGVLFFGEYTINLFFSLALMAVCNMLGCVMLAPSGIGTLDYVFTLLFGTVIFADESIAATVLLYRFLTWIVPFLIGIIPAAFLKKENS